MSLIGALLERRFETIGDVSISQNPSKSLIAALGGWPSASGITITETIAQNLPPVFACDKVLKESVAMLPLKLMRRQPNGDKTPDPSHPVYALLHDLANPTTTATEWKEAAQGHLNIWGNHYSEIERDARNLPRALWPLDPSRMTVDLDGLGQLRYRYRLANSSEKLWIFDPANPPIFHLRANALDGIHGRSPVQMLRDSMGLYKAAKDYNGRFFAHGSHPSGVLQSDYPLQPEAVAKIREDWERLHRGAESAHRVGVLHMGLKWQPIGISQKDAEFLATTKLERSEIAAAFRVPLHMINDLERATFSNIEHQALEFVNYTLMPHLVRWQQAIARDLLNPRSFNTHAAVFVVNALVRGDIAARYNAYAVARQNGWKSANDIRRLEDENLISEADGGDLYLVNGNMVPMRRDPAAMIEPMPTGPVN